MAKTKGEDVLYIRNAQHLRSRIKKYIQHRQSRGVKLSLTQAALILLDEALRQQGIK